MVVKRKVLLTRRKVYWEYHGNNILAYQRCV